MDPALKYPLGFLLGEGDGRPPAHYRRMPFPLPLSVNPKTRIGLASDDAGSIAVIGEAIDPDAPALEPGGIAQQMLADPRQRQAVIDRLIGRFVIIAASPSGEATVQTDAIGLRSVFFARIAGGVVAGSHARMVAEAAASGPAKAVEMPYKWGYPGIDTPFAGVLRLPPNCELSTRSGALRRFFPVGPIPEQSIEEAWSFAFDQAPRAIHGLLLRTPVIVSLSAGLDTRTTLAASRELWPRLGFFTYLQKGPMRAGDLIDMAVARELAGRLGLRHEEIDLASYQPDKKLLAVVAANTFTRHIQSLASAYHERFGAHRVVHIRTNLLELARSNLFDRDDRRAEYRGGPRDARTMAAYYSTRAPLERTDHVLPAFERLVRETDFAAALPWASAWDLYFVEHRMGAWQGGVVSVGEVAFDTIIAFNSRDIVRRFMGVPQWVRSRSPHLVESLQRLLPEARDIPINPAAYPATPP